MLGISGIAHVSLTVTDLERSTAWYREVMGFDILWSLERHGYQKVILTDPATGIIFSLTQHGKRSSGEEFSEFRTGLDHLSFAVPSFRELGQWKARFEELKVPHTDILTTKTGAVLVFRDPDNIQVEMYAPADTAEWAFAFPPVSEAAAEPASDEIAESAHSGS